MIRGMRSLLLLHVVANGLLLWLAYEWLGVDESSAGRLALSAVDALAILALVCWLYGATIVHLQSAESRLNESFRTALRHVGGLLLLAVAALALYGLLGKWSSGLDQPAQRFASWLTWTFHTSPKPATLTTVFQSVFWLLRWVLLPVLLLPLAGAIALRGWTGWRTLVSRPHWMLCLRIPVIAAMGLWLPLLLLQWKQHVPTFGWELTSFTLRTLTAYLLFVISMLLLSATAAHAAHRNAGR